MTEQVLEIEDSSEDEFIVEEEGAEEPVQGKDEADKLITKESVEGANDLRRHIEELRRLNDAKEAARLAAEARAQEREAAARRYQEEAANSQSVAVEQAKAGLKAEADRLSEAARVAMEEGDFKKAQELNRRLYQAEAYLTQLNTAQVQRPVAPVQPAVDPFETAISNYDDRTKQWLRAHPEYVKDRQKAAKAMSAHFSAISEGVDPGSEEYFAFIERSVGLVPTEQEEPKPRKAAPVAAPVSRSAPTKTAPAGKRHVPARIVSLAREQGVELKDWIKHHDALVKSGDMEPLF